MWARLRSAWRMVAARTNVLVVSAVAGVVFMLVDEFLPTRVWTSSALLLAATNCFLAFLSYSSISG